MYIEKKQWATDDVMQLRHPRLHFANVTIKADNKNKIPQRVVHASLPVLLLRIYALNRS